MCEHGQELVLVVTTPTDQNAHRISADQSATLFAEGQGYDWRLVKPLDGVEFASSFDPCEYLPILPATDKERLIRVPTQGGCLGTGMHWIVDIGKGLALDVELFN